MTLVSRSQSNFRKKGILAFSIIIILFVFCRASFANEEKNIVKIDQDDTTITAIDENGTNIWVENIKNNKIKTHVLNDVDGDGKNEVILGTDYNGDKPGFLIFIETDKKILWEYKIGSGRVFDYPQISSDSFSVNSIIVNDFDNDGNKEILVNSQNYPSYPSRLVLLDRFGHLIGEYWNSGRINVIKDADIDNDGHKEIIAGGLNDSMDYSPVFFVLNPLNMKDQAVEYYIPIEKPEVQPRIITGVTEIVITNDSIIINAGDGRFFNYSKNMELYSIIYNKYYVREKQRIKKENWEKFLYSTLGLSVVTILGLIAAFVRWTKKWRILTRLRHNITKQYLRIKTSILGILFKLNGK